MTRREGDIQRLGRYLASETSPWNAEAEQELYLLWQQAGETTEPDAVVLERLRADMQRSNKNRVSHRFVVLPAVAAMLAGVMYAAGFLTARVDKPFVEEAPTHHILSTAEGSVGEFTLPDGTTVWLNSASRLEYDGDFTCRNARLHGEGYFDVAHDDLHPFTLELENISVKVLGTKFDARSYGSGAIEDVILRQGRVNITDSTGRTLSDMLPDERLAYAPATGIALHESVPAIDYCRWMEARLVFSNERLQSIVTNLERRYNISISLDHEIDPTQRLSLTVVREPLGDVLTVLGALTSSRARYTAPDAVTMQRVKSKK